MGQELQPLSRTQLEITLWSRESMVPEWYVAKLLASCSLSEAEHELSRNEEWLCSQGYSIDFMRVLSQKLRDVACRRLGASPDGPGMAKIERAEDLLLSAHR